MAARGRVTIGGFLAALACGMATGCLFGGGAPGTLDQLVVTQYRYNIDEAHDLTRVFGRVQNTGEKRVPAAEVVASLQSRSGALKGENRVPIPSLGAGETHDFSLDITMHGKATKVEIRVVPVGEAMSEPKEES